MLACYIFIFPFNGRFSNHAHGIQEFNRLDLRKALFINPAVIFPEKPAKVICPYFGSDPFIIVEDVGKSFEKNNG